LVNNYNVAVAAGAAAPGDSIGPLTVAAATALRCEYECRLCKAAMGFGRAVSFFDLLVESSLANFLTAVGGVVCRLANQVLVL